MFRRRKATQSEVVARRMRRYFAALTSRDPEQVALAYGRALWRSRAEALADHKQLARARFTVALTTGDDIEEFRRITKRATLVSDTLLLSHDGTGNFHSIGLRKETWEPGRSRGDRANELLAMSDNIAGWADPPAPSDFDRKVHQEWYGMLCPDLAGLGSWLLDAEGLLTSGLAWYLPTFASGKRTELENFTSTDPIRGIQPYRSADFLIRDGRAVEMSGTQPLKSRLVRPVMSIDLPFVDGVDLKTFSELTVQEFASYTAFRDVLRLSLLELDDSLHADQSEREMLRLALRIKDEIRGVATQMRTVRRKRAVAVTGAALGSVSALLVAVYGPALEAAIAALGATGGVWGVVHAAAEHSSRDLRDGTWYYVWALSRASTMT